MPANESQACGMPWLARAKTPVRAWYYVQGGKDMREPVTITERIACGPGHPLLWILGPCVIETRELTLRIAQRLRGLADQLELSLVFKASFDKANRTSGKSFRGPGLEAGLRILETVKRETGLPVTTDVHECCQVG